MRIATPTRTALRTFTSLALLLCASAHSQPVRKCQIDGRTVFQSSPCPAEARVASAAPRAAAIDTPTAPKRKTLADLLRERDGADRGRPQVHESQGDGAHVLRSRMGAV